MRTKTNSRYFWWIILLSGVVIMFALVGCDTDSDTADASGGLQAWLDQPPTGSSIPLASFTLKAHARDIGGSGVSQINFLVNTVPVASITTDPTLPLAYAETEWNPAAPGQYEIQVQAFNAEGSALSDMAIICVGDDCGAVMVAEASAESVRGRQRRAGGTCGHLQVPDELFSRDLRRRHWYPHRLHPARRSG